MKDFEDNNRTFNSNFDNVADPWENHTFAPNNTMTDNRTVNIPENQQYYPPIEEYEEQSETNNNSIKWIIPWILVGMVVGLFAVTGFILGPSMIKKVSDHSFSVKDLPIIGTMLNKNETESEETDTEKVETESEETDTEKAETEKGETEKPETEQETTAVTEIVAIAEPEPEPEPQTQAQPVQYQVEVKPISTVTLDYTKQVTVVSADASSELVQYDKTVSNKPILAFDGNKNTSWQENASGAGIGEYVIGYFTGVENIKYISFRLGNWKNDDYYHGNYRPTKLGLELGNEYFSVAFPSDWVEYVVEITPACPASSLKTIIEDVTSTRYEWADTPISDILIFRE